MTDSVLLPYQMLEMTPDCYWMTPNTPADPAGRACTLLANAAGRWGRVSSYLFSPNTLQSSCAGWSLCSKCGLCFFCLKDLLTSGLVWILPRPISYVCVFPIHSTFSISSVLVSAQRRQEAFCWWVSTTLLFNPLGLNSYLFSYLIPVVSLLSRPWAAAVIGPS